MTTPAPCTCYTDEIMEAVFKAVGRMNAGARVIMTSRPVAPAKLKALKLKKRFDQRLKYARGSLRFLVYEKL